MAGDTAASSPMAMATEPTALNDGAIHTEEMEIVLDVEVASESARLKKRAVMDVEGAEHPSTAACLICESSDVKYRCPRCERITCSLACCVAHKKEFACDGKRDRTKYIPTKQFTDADLSSDFFFLEEISRSTNSAARSRSQLGVNVKKYGHQKPQQKKRRVNGATATLAHGETVNPHVPADWLTRFPVAFQVLVQHATKRGVALTLLAPGMSKRVRNTSYMNTKDGKLCWRVEWNFPSAEVAVSLVEERADDALTPFELLDKYLERRPENTGLRSKLKPYASPTWRDDLVLLLRKEFTASPQPQYYRLDGNLSLESNLKRKAVVEFPVIAVVLRSELSQYAVANDFIEVVELAGQDTDAINGVDAEVGNEDENDDDNGENDGEDVMEDLVEADKDVGEEVLFAIAEEGSQEESDDAVVVDAEMPTEV